MEKTVCELFAGIGGFRLGLQKASPDWKTVWFNQWEPSTKRQMAYECYTKHFGNIDEYNNVDITSVPKDKIPDHNLLVGGFPCQSYSVATLLSSSKGIEDAKKGILWWQIADIIKAKNPSFCLFENVDRLLKSPAKQRGRDFGVILTCLNELGYNVEWRVVDASDYGFVQRRKRTFIFASKKTSNYSKNLFDISHITDIFFYEGFFAKAFPVLDNISGYTYTDIKNVSMKDIFNNFKFNFKNTGYMHNGMIYTTDTIPHYTEQIRKNLSDIIVNDAPEECYLTEKQIESMTYLKGKKCIDRVSKDGYQYQYKEGSVAFPDLLNKPARTMLTSEASINRCSHVIEDPITKRYRFLTPVEVERIQGFDDNWTEGLPKRSRYFCIGNALVVDLVERMGHILNDIFIEESKKWIRKI